MHDRIDERRFGELLTESDDMQSDAMRGARSDLDDYVDAAREIRAEQRRSGLAPSVAVAGVVGAVALTTATPAFAVGVEVQLLQTAAALENLAVITYQTALTLPFIGGSAAVPVVTAFATKTMAQHAEHALAFNAAVKKLGGAEQTGVPAKYEAIVKAALPGIKGPADVVALAITLENVAAQTYVKDVGLVNTPELRQLFASVAGVEAQHVAILLAVQALLAANLPNLITLPPDAAKLPGAAGKIGFPDAFYKTDMAAGAEDGAVK